MKKVKAVAPYVRQGIVNFKMEAYNAWIDVGGDTANTHYPYKPFVGYFHIHDFPSICKFKHEARLRFMEPINRYFDAFPDYLTYEIIPMIWDCWPCLDNRLSSWLKKHEVKAAVFTSEQAAERIQKRFPEMNIFVITEGVNTSLYNEGKELKDRSIDVLEFGRSLSLALPRREGIDSSIKYVCTRDLSPRPTDEELRQMMGDAKITIALPKCDTDASIGAGQETLTQRYWENMLSRVLMAGHAPKELVDLIGYNPCIELDGFVSHRGMRDYKIEPLDADVVNKQLISILKNIADYQGLVDKNREVALKMAPWEIRMNEIKEWLNISGYCV